MQISMKACYKLILRFFDGDAQAFPKFLLKQEVRDEVDFLDADKHEGFLQVYFNNLGTKVSYKVILSLLMGMIILKLFSKYSK